MIDINKIIIKPEQKCTTILFLIAFVLLVGFGVVTKQEQIML